MAQVLGTADAAPGFRPAAVVSLPEQIRRQLVEAVTRGDLRPGDRLPGEATLAHHGVCALFVKMPYYGPRRPLGSTARMISLDPKESVRGMTQAVLDIRRATACLAGQAEVDGHRLGLFGISLGAITGALAAEC